MESVSQTGRGALIVFMRYPEEGKVKTRLAASMGPFEAARLYRKLLRRSLGVVADFKRLTPPVDLFLAFTPLDREKEVREAYAGPWEFLPQEGIHLGDRMERAIHQVQSRGYGSVVLTGSDLADTQARDYVEAFHALKRGDAVLGPAADGGFYLIGLRRPCSQAFRFTEWGTDGICRRTEEQLIKNGFRVHKTSIRHDIDCPEDLGFRTHDAFLSATLSVIIPTLASHEKLAVLLSTLESQLWPDDEIIVVSGEGSEGSRRQGEPPSGTRTRWIHAPRGRGLQLNRGVQASRGNLLFFLHDDSMPPAQFAYLVRKITKAPDMSLGCFQLGYSPTCRLMEIIAAGANARTRFLKLPYGDQGLFCRRETYEKAGGFKQPFLMEDVDFVRSCRRYGQLMILPEKIQTSPRRYVALGVLRTFLKNQLVMLLFNLGVDNRRLYGLYYGRNKSVRVLFGH